MCPADADSPGHTAVVPPHAAAAFDQLRTAWESCFDTIVVVDAERRYLRVNPAAEELFGAPAHEILDARIDDFTPPELHGVLRRLWDELKRRGSLHSPYEMLRADGARSLVEFRAVSDRGRDERLIVAREVLPDLVARRGRFASGAGKKRLTPRERQILQLAADGGSTRGVADILVVSPATVKTHFEHVYEKLGVRDRASAVAEGLRRGLID